MNEREKLEAIHKEIEELTREKDALKKKSSLTKDQQEELETVETLLTEAYDNKRFYLELIDYLMRNPCEIEVDSESRSFFEADSEWVQLVTGVNTSYRRWVNYEVDESIHPRPGFQTKYEEIGKTFHQLKKGGRRIFLNLFLTDILLRDEFEGDLRIYPELEYSLVRRSGRKKRIMKGVMDYAVGVGKGTDILRTTMPSNVLMVAVEASTSIGDISDLWRCVSQAATLYKTRLDAEMTSKKVWGILSNAESWQFIFINEEGLLWRTEPFFLDLREYEESKVLKVYRILYYLVKSCYESSK
jgi:hypothetical protein